jgi:hypothetical protein
MVSATATALRIFGPASAATPAAAESRSSAQFSAAPNWSFPLNHHIPCSRTPPAVPSKWAKVTSNILAIYTCTRKLGLLTPRQMLLACLLTCCPEALATTSASVGLIKTTQPCESRSTLPPPVSNSLCFRHHNSRYIHLPEKAACCFCQISNTSPCRRRRFSIVSAYRRAQRTHLYPNVEH